MSAKDRYSVKLVCMECSTEGVANVSENDHPHAPPQMNVKGISEGFRVLKSTGDILTTTFCCTVCGTKATVSLN